MCFKKPTDLLSAEIALKPKSIALQYAEKVDEELHDMEKKND